MFLGQSYHTRVLIRFLLHITDLLFFAGSVHLRIPESSPVGTAIGSIKASDADIGRNAELEYRIIDGDGRDMFDIVTQKDTQEGIITVRKVDIFQCDALCAWNY